MANRLDHGHFATQHSCVSLLHESKLSLKLAIPLMIGQLSQMLMGVIDTLMVGRLGVTELAALTFANSLFYVPFVFGIGVLTAVSILSSTARGAQKPEAARASCREGFYLGLGLGLLLFLFCGALSYKLDWFGQPENVTAATRNFYRIIMASTIPALASIALKNHADALNRPWIPFWIFLSGIILNVLLNWMLIFGNLGCPALGFEGAAWATLVARFAMLAAILTWLVSSKDLKEWVPHRWFLPMKFKSMRKLLRVGVPASLQMLSEVSAFSAAGIIMGLISTQAMAAHQVAISMTGTAFMIPLGFSMALTVRIGEAYGAKDPQRLKAIAHSGWVVLVCTATISATCFIFFGETMASWFINESSLIELTAALLIICAAFQFFDAQQVGSASMLRGMHDTRVPALVAFVSYWVIGIPAGLIFAFSFDMGARGVWWGLAIGLAMAALTLGWRMVVMMRYLIRSGSP